ncbi:EAL domain-containing protein [Methylobacterium organophilum]|nr:EAL domain-containing protein [Methylobacterium organophilum]UMY18153.1 EAL domain-containing protein [Methylobacterium organophilum]
MMTNGRLHGAEVRGTRQMAGFLRGLDRRLITGCALGLIAVALLGACAAILLRESEAERDQTAWIDAGLHSADTVGLTFDRLRAAYARPSTEDAPAGAGLREVDDLRLLLKAHLAAVLLGSRSVSASQAAMDARDTLEDWHAEVVAQRAKASPDAAGRAAVDRAARVAGIQIERMKAALAADKALQIQAAGRAARLRGDILSAATLFATAMVAGMALMLCARRSRRRGEGPIAPLPVPAVAEPTDSEASADRDPLVEDAQPDAEEAGSVVVVLDGAALPPEREEGAAIADHARLATAETENRRLTDALETMSQGLCLYDESGRLAVVNARYSEIYRLPPGAVRVGMSCAEVMAASLAAGNHPAQELSDLLQTMETLVVSDDASHFQELGDGRVVAIRARPTRGGGFVATYEDVSERWEAETRIAHMARHDALTELPNRVLLRERIEAALTQVGCEAGFAVHCLDLDHFKQINDTLGHNVGDELLCAVAHRLRACIRDIDTVARLGGDEFAIVQLGIETPEDAVVQACRMVEVLREPYALTEHTVTVGVSIGIAIAPEDGMTASRLLKYADVALYRAKAEGRGRHRLFEPEMGERLQARRLLEIDLREALTRDAFELHYQPIYSLADDRICGFEALLRWNHPERGRVSPAEFVPLAEEIGLIVPLGEWVIRQACDEARRWPEGLKVAVNVSPAQFVSARLIEIVRDALSESGLSAGRLELEITETVLLQNGGATVAMLHALKTLGARISMDDFGTGYSSLSYLRSFPFDKIKIDQAFTRDLAVENGSDFIVRAVISLGASLGMTTTAEGVETPEQLARLREEGCDEVQGYLFSRPVPAAELPALIARWNGAQRAVA